jgi:DNA-directed RNA polymerase omega subunit
VTEEAEDVVETVEPQPEPVKAPPIESRFLFVDVAALRAKQLRRGALPRLKELREPETEAEAEVRPDVSRKAERIAMEEVRRGLVGYDLPPLRPPTGEPA